MTSARITSAPAFRQLDRHQGPLSGDAVHHQAVPLAAEPFDALLHDLHAQSTSVPSGAVARVVLDVDQDLALRAPGGQPDRARVHDLRHSVLDGILDERLQGEHWHAHV